MTSVLNNGDIILTNKKSILSHLMGMFQDDVVNWGHTGIVDADNKAIIHATAWGIDSMPIDDFVAKYKHYIIIRRVDINYIDTFKIVGLARKTIGLHYSWFRIFLQTLDHIGNTNFFTGLYASNRYQVCSSLVAWCYYVLFKIKFNEVEWQSCDPDDIEDDFESNRDKWVLVDRQ